MITMAYEALDFYDVDMLLTEEEQMVRDSAAEFLAEKAGPNLLREIRDSENPLGYSAELWQQILAGLELPSTRMLLSQQAVLARLVKALTKQRIRHVVIDGNVSPRDREIAVRAFQAHEVPVFIGTKAAKEGITLTAARHLLFLERYWTSADEEQAEDRIRRYWSFNCDSHGFGPLDTRCDGQPLLIAHCVRIEPGNRSARFSDAPRPHGVVHLHDGLGHQIGGNDIYHLPQGHMIGEVRYPQRAGQQNEIALTRRGADNLVHLAGHF